MCGWHPKKYANKVGSSLPCVHTFWYANSAFLMLVFSKLSCVDCELTQCTHVHTQIHTHIYGAPFVSKNYMFFFCYLYIFFIFLIFIFYFLIFKFIEQICHIN